MFKTPLILLLTVGVSAIELTVHAERLEAESIEASTHFQAVEGSGKIDFKQKVVTANGKNLPLIKKATQDKIDLTFDEKMEGGTLKLTMDGHTQTVPLRPAGIELFDQGLGVLDINDTCIVLDCADPAIGFTGKALRSWVGSQNEHGFAFSYHIAQVTTQHFLMRMESKGSQGGANITQKFEWFLTKPKS